MSHDPDAGRCLCPACWSEIIVRDRESLAFQQGYTRGAAVAFGLMGMAEAIQRRDKLAARKEAGK